MGGKNGHERGKQTIFIGIPCYREVDPEYLEDMMRFAFHCGRRMPQYNFELGIKTKSEQFRARNAIVDGAVQSGSDWTAPSTMALRARNCSLLVLIPNSKLY